MKNTLLILALLLTGCTPFQQNKLDGFWRLVVVCPQGHTIQTSQINRISNDSLMVLTPDNIDTLLTIMNLTKDSMTIFDDCGVLRHEYELIDSKIIKLKASDWQFERVDQASIQPQDLFDRYNVQLNLPISNTASSVPPKNSKIIFIGHSKMTQYPNCNVEGDRSLSIIEGLNELEEPNISDSLVGPFEIEDGFVIRFADMNVSTKELYELKSALPHNFPEHEKVSLLIYADENVSASTIDNFSAFFKGPNFDVFRSFVSEKGKIDFVYQRL